MKEAMSIVWGAILYQILSGRNAYQGSMIQIIKNKRSNSHPSIRNFIGTAHWIQDQYISNQIGNSLQMECLRTVPDELVQVCEKAMQKEQADRYQDALELADAIQSWLDGSQRKEKALAVIKQANESERRMLQLQEQKRNCWAEADILLSKKGVTSTEAWKLWQKSQQMIEEAEELKHEIEQLLQGALIYAPEMVETHQRLCDIEYKDYLDAVLRKDKRVTKKIARKLRVHMEFLPREDKRQWEAKKLVDLNSINALRKRRGTIVGREKQKTLIIENLKANQLVSLIGSAGVGKTHIALEVASHWRKENQCEIIFCDATVATNALGITQVVGEALGIQLNPDDPVKQVGDELQLRGSVLVIFNNLEQLIKEAVKVIQSWLEDTKELKILLTSRIPLGIENENIIKLPPLSLLEGMELFVLRAQQHLHDIQLDSNNREIIGRIVQRLDSLPLAIELAAARVSMLKLEEIEKRLSKNFGLLRTRLRDAEQIALLGALDWSWDLLTDWEKSALAQCSVFRNGFDLQAAEGIIDLSTWENIPDVIDIMEALFDDNLILKNRLDDGRLRYGMLSSIHEYAKQKCITEESDDHTIRRETTNRHTRYFSELLIASQEENDLSSLKISPQLLIELDNFIAGTVYGLPEDAGNCCLAAMTILKMRGPVSLGIELTSTFLKREDLNNEIHLKILLERITCLRISGLINKAREENNIVLQLVEEIQKEHDSEESSHESIQSPQHNKISEAINKEYSPHPQKTYTKKQRLELLRAYGFLEIGHLELEQCFYDKALHQYNQALEIYTNLQFHSGRANSMSGIANLLSDQGELEDSLKMNYEVLMLYRQLENKRREGITLDNISTIYISLRKYDKAIEYSNNAILIQRQLNNKREEGVIIGGLGIIYNYLGEYNKALEYYYKALHINKEIGNKKQEGNNLGNIGIVYQLLGEHKKAIEYYKQAIDIQQKIKIPVTLGIFLGNLGDVYNEINQEKEAIDCLRRAIEVCDSINYPAAHAFRASLALILVKNQQLEEALLLLKQSEGALNDIPLEHGKYLCKKGEVLLLADDIVAAQQSLKQAQDLADKLETKEVNELTEAIQKLKNLLREY
jgi:predicted ATPase